MYILVDLLRLSSMSELSKPERSQPGRDGIGSDEGAPVKVPGCDVQLALCQMCLLPRNSSVSLPGP